MVKKLALLSAILFVGLAFFALDARAQERSGITIKPAVIEDEVEPGTVFSDAISVTNTGSEDQLYYLQSGNIRGLSEEGFPIFAEEGESTDYEIASWVKFSYKSLNIPAGETRKVPFSIVVPEDASPGSHLGSIFLSLESEAPKGIVGSGVGYQVATLINLRIEGDIREDALIREFSTDKAVYSKPNVDFVIDIQNTGNVLIRPRGLLEITNMMGDQVATIVVNEDLNAIFPDGRRVFEANWEGSGLHFGRYDAILSMIYGNETKKTISSSLSFWVLPLNIIGPIIGVVIGIILITIFITKLYIKRRLALLSEAAGVSKYRIKAEISRQKKDGPLTKALAVAIVLLVITIILLIILFFFFA
jgi:hypothetical protein